jgi:molybdopterin converting factor small subunit
MELTLLAFASASDACGFSSRSVAYRPEETAREIVGRVAPTVDVQGWRVALDQAFADWDRPVGECRELAILPPVSGG